MDIKTTKSEDEKARLIRSLSNAGVSLTIGFDEPIDVDLKHEINSNGTVTVFPPYDYATLEKWLYTGNWLAYHPNNIDFKGFDIFRASDDIIATQMNEFGFTILIDSFHDDIEWKIVTYPEQKIQTYCPVCNQSPLKKLNLEEGLAAKNCDTCCGHWLSRSSYMKWLKLQPEIVSEKPLSEFSLETNETQRAKLCPNCEKILLRYNIGHGLHFSVDHCGSCGGIWLDGNEWAILKKKGLHDEIHKIFSTSCKKN